MHPALALSLALSGLFALQAMAWPALAGFALLLAASPAVRAGWWPWVNKSRWLMLSIWLVLAYGLAGEPLAGLSWAPTLEGCALANLQLFRFLLTLAVLAWLFARLPAEALAAALWTLLSPLRASGWQVDRLVVRLSLVMAHLAEGAPRVRWQDLASLGEATVGGGAFASGASSLRLSVRPLAGSERAALWGLLLCWVAAVLWSFL